MGPRPMLAIDVASGRPMTPLPEIRVARTGYVADIPRRGDPGNLLGGFVEWLAAETRSAGGLCGPASPI